MRSLTISVPLLAAFAGGCTLDFEEPIGEREQAIVNGQINNGDPAVGLVVMNNLGTCTGTLIADRVILTARHCIVQENGTVLPPTDVGMFWGTQPVQGDTPTLVTSMEYHPSADIAVLELAAPGPTEPIPMNTAALDPHIGAAVRVAGYGVTTEDGNDSGTKRVGTTALYDLANTELGTVMLIGSTGSKTCYGDSGGPAFMTMGSTEMIAGVTSFGTGSCDAPDTLDGNVRVDIYHSWIMDFVNRVDPNGLPGSPDPTDPTDPTDPNDPGDPSDPSDPSNPSNPSGQSPSDLVGGCSTSGTGGSTGTGLAILLAVAFAASRRRR